MPLLELFEARGLLGCNLSVAKKKTAFDSVTQGFSPEEESALITVVPNVT